MVTMSVRYGIETRTIELVGPSSSYGLGRSSHIKGASDWIKTLTPRY